MSGHARLLTESRACTLPQASRDNDSFREPENPSDVRHRPFSAFLAAVFLLNVTPGPDTAYIVGRSVAQGRGAGLLSALGISAGCCVHTLACAFGLTALIAASSAAFTVIKFVGAIYLIYLGIRLSLLHGRRDWRRQRAASARARCTEAAACSSLSKASGPMC